MASVWIMPSFVIAFVVCFFVFIMIYNKRLMTKFGALPIYERSELLVLIGSTCNLIETLTNILAYVLLVRDYIPSKDSRFIFLAFSFYFTRLYPACMGLRIYRMLLLSKYRSGYLSRSMLLCLTSKTFMFLSINIYAVLILVIYLVDNYIIRSSSYEPYDLNRTIYGLEAIFFILLSIWTANNPAHPSLVVEYFFYSIIWGTGAIGDENTSKDRFLFIVPLRNSLLLFTSMLSLQNHCKLIRPPLPFEPSLEEIFSIKELFKSFYSFTRIFGSEVQEEVNLLIQSHKAKFYGKLSQFIDKCRNSGMLDEEINKSLEDSFQGITFKLEACLEPHRLKYLKSEDFQLLKKTYFISFD